MEHAKALRACDPNTTRIFMGRTFETLKETSFACVVTIQNRSSAGYKMSQAPFERPVMAASSRYLPVATGALLRISCTRG